MKTSTVEKIPAGKLIRIEVTGDDNTVTAVKVTGDFFLHPEEEIFSLEEALSELSWQSSETEISEKLQGWQLESEAVLVGFTLTDLTKTVFKALQCGA